MRPAPSYAANTPVSPYARPSRRGTLVWLRWVAGLAAACASGDPIDPPRLASYAVSLTATTLSVGQGASGAVAVSLDRKNFTAPVSLTVENLPPGVTASFSPNPVTANASLLTIAAPVESSPGSSTVTVRATTTGGGDQSAELTLTITLTGDYSLTAAPESVSLASGGSDQSTVTINRTGGFAGSVALAVTGQPPGLTATLNPSVPTGDVATLSLAASSQLPAGNYPLTLTGSSAGRANRTLTLPVTVAGPPGMLTVDFSACQPLIKPVWFAVQDGTGPWTRINGSNDRYAVTVSSARGGYAYVIQGGSITAVVFGTQAELTGARSVCSGRSVTGTVAGLAPNTIARVSLGGRSATASASAPNFTIFDGAEGANDLVAWRTDPGTGPSTGDRGVLLRGVNPPPGGSIGTVDFAGAGSFAPASAIFTVSGAAPGETLRPSASYLTGAACHPAPLYFSPFSSSSSMTVFGVPAAQQEATDFHSVLVDARSTASNGTVQSRSVREVFRVIGNRAVTLGPDVTATVTSAGGAYRRVQVVTTPPAEYRTELSLTYLGALGGSTVNLIASFGYLGSGQVTLAMPDFSGVPGWLDSYAPPATGSVSWSWRAIGRTYATTACVEGTIERTAGADGSL